MNAEATTANTTALPTMRAVRQEQYCSQSELCVDELPLPIAEPGRVIVKMHAAGVNPYDLHMITGKPYLVRTQAGLRVPKRKTPGVDVAGVVTEVGAKVTSFAVGDEVFGYGNGSFAEYVVCAERSLAPKPNNVSFDRAAAVPLAGFSALQALRDKGQLRTGQQVLINGAAGGVGTMAVQIAKSFGAHVTAVCSTRNVDMVAGLGADRVIDYKVNDFATESAKYDLAVDTVGSRSFSAVRGVLKPSGRVVQVGGPKGGNWIQPITFVLKGMMAYILRSPSFSPFLAQENHDDLMALRELLASGELTPHVSERFALGDAVKALDLIASGHAQGKIVITP